MTSLREKKKLWTRQAIEEAALSLFLEHGYDATTVDEIAEAAGVSRSTFFRYFETKEAAFFAQQEGRIQRFRDRLAAHPERTPLERVQAAFLETASEYTESRERILAQTRIIRTSRNLLGYDQQLDQRWENAVSETLAEGAQTPAEHRRSALIAGAVIGIARSMFRAWIEDEGARPLTADAELAIELFQRLYP